MAGIPQWFALHAPPAHRSLMCVGCARPRPQRDYLSIAHGVMKHISKGTVSQQEANMSLQQKTNMSLDNTSHPGRQGPDELVPSRYALRVGDIDVMVVSDGVLSLPGAMLGHNVDPAVRGLAGGHVPAVGRARLGAEPGRGA